VRKLFEVLSIVILAVNVTLVAQNNPKIPKGWLSAGNKPSEFEMGLDRSVFQNGNSSAYLKSKAPKENEFGTLMQIISGDNYIGKRLRLTGYIKSEEVKGWGGMWMRIDGASDKQLGFDNMLDRAIKGTTDWKKYEIVLDIPTGCKDIAYGVLLGGKGEIWFDNMKMEEVDKNIPVTNMLKESAYPMQPINLDLEE